MVIGVVILALLLSAVSVPLIWWFTGWPPTVPQMWVLWVMLSNVFVLVIGSCRAWIHRRRSF